MNLKLPEINFTLDLARISTYLTVLKRVWNRNNPVFLGFDSNMHILVDFERAVGGKTSRV